MDVSESFSIAKPFVKVNTHKMAAYRLYIYIYYIIIDVPVIVPRYCHTMINSCAPYISTPPIPRMGQSRFQYPVGGTIALHWNEWALWKEPNFYLRTGTWNGSFWYGGGGGDINRYITFKGMVHEWPLQSRFSCSLARQRLTPSLQAGGYVWFF